MAIIIEQFSVQSFRGIHNLTMNNLNHVNLIVGDNNCGKTSVLEALMLLRDPVSLTNIIRIARLRDSNLFHTTSYESFINLFSKDDEFFHMGVTALITNNIAVACSLQGQENQILLDAQDIEKNTKFTNKSSENHIFENMETNAFKGTLSGRFGDFSGSTTVSLHEFTKFSGMEINHRDYLKIQYLAPFDHIRGNIIGRILRNDDYKNLCIHVLQIFDPDIVDLLILKNEQTGRPIEYIKHRRLGNMPISTYGDGIKKVLSFANAIVQSEKGILLIDEIETAIHSKYYDSIFNFLVLACKKFNVQLFITTHSIEAVDGLLSTQNYDEQTENDNISVITLKKGRDKTYTRILSGRQVASDRDSFGFEVRL